MKSIETLRAEIKDRLSEIKTIELENAFSVGSKITWIGGPEQGCAIVFVDYISNKIAYLVETDNPVSDYRAMVTWRSSPKLV